MLFIQRLNPASVALAWIWSLFAPVAYWRADYLPAWCVRRFEPLDPSDHFTMEEWYEQTERAFLAWRGAGTAPAGEVTCTISARQVDFSKAWGQWLALNFEERYLFLEMVRRRGGNARVASSVIDSVEPSKALIESRKIRAARGFGVLERLWLGLLALGKATRQARSLFRRAGTAVSAQTPILWSGISMSEIAQADRQLSFSFAVERGLLAPQSVLFFTPAEPALAARERLARLGIRWTTVAAFGFLPFGDKVRTLGRLAWIVLRGIAGSLGGLASFTRWRFAVDALPWIAAAERLQPAAHVNSVSNSWPEPVEVSALNSLGLTTVNWSYGANTFCFLLSKPEFKDLALLRSLPAAKEIWVWTKEVERWLSARGAAKDTTIRITGPVMCGDSRWLAQTPEAARAQYGLKPLKGLKYVAIFDVPPIRRGLRHGPTPYPTAMLDQFFKGIERLLERFPDIAVVLKPKRSLAEANRDFSDSMQEMLAESSPWQRAGRVVALPHDIDPYIPVALADICIGVPFTSPVIAALQSGRHGLFHDPLCAIQRVPGAPELMAHLTRGTDELEKRVASYLTREPSGREWPDPGEAFTLLLREVSGDRQRRA